MGRDVDEAEVRGLKGRERAGFWGGAAIPLPARQLRVCKFPSGVPYRVVAAKRFLAYYRCQIAFPGILTNVNVHVRLCRRPSVCRVSSVCNVRAGSGSCTLLRRLKFSAMFPRHLVRSAGHL